ncbi:DNA mismatch repair protein MutS [Tamlana sp. 2_MG-2023]|uniref:Smr/MutS family protein n=1 Tax=unclassified Tamlana TaxID=2614803 RepID=UPI0026E1E264|nr:MULTISPECIES: Smr/MutS family protein [unclassified Tamlana]MDO6761552.1 DNA mismatch repair protein MutS [Tamlana sp. 2_MG-2023]MDO6792318.1 DNA mismatch repair protein MutS [Tamlana sp. 1_MG-2023]
MNFKLGDFVLVLDEDLSGTITNIKGDTISIETEDGFLLDFQSFELVKNEKEASLKGLFSKSSISAVISEKEQPKRKQQVNKRAKDRYEPTMEVDLHIHHLVKSSRGMSNFDMLTLQLDTARHKLDFAISKRIQKIVFIHGVGEGVLKTELEYLFGRYNNVKYYDANYQKYGLGATEVYIFQNVASN